MFIRDVFIASLLGIFGYAGAACANSCANVEVMSTWDQSGLRETEVGISAVGTFRIEGEGDEAKQPLFNLTMLNCEKQVDDRGKATGRRCSPVSTAVIRPSAQHVQAVEMPA
jgi:hypothetical protein